MSVLEPCPFCGASGEDMQALRESGIDQEPSEPVLVAAHGDQAILEEGNS